MQCGAGEGQVRSPQAGAAPSGGWGTPRQGGDAGSPEACWSRQNCPGRAPRPGGGGRAVGGWPEPAAPISLWPPAAAAFWAANGRTQPRIGAANALRAGNGWDGMVGDFDECQVTVSKWRQPLQFYCGRILERAIGRCSGQTGRASRGAANQFAASSCSGRAFMSAIATRIANFERNRRCKQCARCTSGALSIGAPARLWFAVLRAMEQQCSSFTCPAPCWPHRAVQRALVVPRSP